MDKNITLCCIADCNRVGRFVIEGRLFCQEHYAEELGAYASGEPCAIEDCKGPGVFFEMDTRRWYCVVHAWKVDRQKKEEKVDTRTEIEIFTEDAIRAHGQGLAISEDQLPTVPEDIAEQCRRELKIAEKSGWKRES